MGLAQGFLDGEWRSLYNKKMEWREKGGRIRLKSSILMQMGGKAER